MNIPPPPRSCPSPNRPAGLSAPLWESLSGACSRLEPAGALRRRGCAASRTGELELVAVPRIQVLQDPRGPGRPIHRDLLRATVTDMAVRKECLLLEAATSRDVPCHHLLHEEGRLVIWVASPHQFGSVLLWRTGSREHVEWLCERARRRRMAWTPCGGLCSGLRRMGSEESDLYAGLGLRFVPPDLREAGAFEDGQFELPDAEPGQDHASGGGEVAA